MKHVKRMSLLPHKPNTSEGLSHQLFLIQSLKERMYKSIHLVDVCILLLYNLYFQFDYKQWCILGYMEYTH